MSEKEQQVLRQERALLASEYREEQVGMVIASQLLARLSQLSSWTEVPDTYTPAELSEFYGLCIQRIVFDDEAQTRTVLWLPAMARILHQASWLVDMRKGSRR